MPQFDNFFDSVLAQADDAIRGVMGTDAIFSSGGHSFSVSGVFDDPDNVSYPVGGLRIEGTSPSLFVKTADIGGVQRLDTVVIQGKSYWVDRMGPDDGGSRHIWLGTGVPPTSNRRR